MILTVEISGTITFANRPFRHAVSLDDEPLDGQSLYERVHPFDHADLQAWLQRTGLGEDNPAGDRIRLVLKSPDGGTIPVEGCATRQTTHNGSTVLHVLLIDVSERERDASLHQENAELFQLLSQHAPWGVFITDAVGRLRFANRHWRSLADVLHIPSPRGVWWQMVHPGDRDRVLAQWNSALSGGHEFAAEYRVNGHGMDTAPRWVRTRIAQSWTHEGHRGSCVGITEDVTLQRQADDVLRRAHEQLEERVQSRTRELHETNHELTELIYAVTHDLKAPLRGINRLADWLAEDHAAQLSPEGSSLIVKIQTRVRQLHTLIDGMLAYSRIGRNLDPDQTVDLNTVLADAIRHAHPPANFSITLPETLPTVTGVPHQLHQVFQNIVDNAIKFMDKPRGRLQITHHRTGAAWEFSATDNGPGIPARFHEKVFALFQRLEATPDCPGAGIGLALVKRIIETRGGRIHISSEEGHGTTFHFTWPDTPRHPVSR
jgi:PAS domain S-box-containing protein